MRELTNEEIDKVSGGAPPEPTSRGIFTAYNQGENLHVFNANEVGTPTARTNSGLPVGSGIKTAHYAQPDES